MARRIRGQHAPGTVREFVPTSYQNDKDPEPVVVRLRQPTQRDREAFDAELVDDGAVTMRDAETPTLGARSELARRACRRFVVSVDRYSREDVAEDGTVQSAAIATGEDLATYGEREIVHEVAAEILGTSGLEEPEKKSSSAPPASPCAETTPSPGTVVDAAPSGPQ